MQLGIMEDNAEHDILKITTAPQFGEAIAKYLLLLNSNTFYILIYYPTSSSPTINYYKFYYELVDQLSFVDISNI